MSYQQEQMNNLLYKNNIQNNNISTNSNNIIILNSNPNINNSYSLNNPLIPAASGKGNNSFDNTNNDINPNIEHNLVNKAGAAVREPYLDNSFDNSLERAQKLDRLKKYSIIPYVICGMAAILSALIGILGIAFLNKTISSVSTCLIISGFSSMVIFIFGILAFYFYINDHSETTVMETPKQSIKRELLNIFIYLIIILLFIFAIFVIGTLVNRHEARSFLTGLGQNAEDWRKVYGNETYSNIESLISALIYSVGIISLVMIFIISIILILTYCFLETYRFVQTLAMFFSFVFFTIGCCLVYLALFADLFKDVANIQNTIPPWIPLAVLIAGGITLAFGLFGYISILVASKSLIKIFSTICGVFGIFVFACTVYSYIYSYRIKNLFESNCKDIIEMLPQDFLIKYVGCSRKYVYISNHLISECPKDRNMIAWEVNQETIKNLKAENPDIIFDNIPLTYGCYDNLCCTQAYNFISTNYLSLFSGFLLISTFICSLSSFLFCMELEGGNNTYYNKSFFSLSNMLIILLMIGATTTLILAAIKIPEKPNEDPTRVKPNPSVKNSVPKDLIVWKNLTESNIEHIAAIKNDIAQFTNITEIKTSCGNDCPDIRYTFKLSSQDGSFMRNKTSKWKNIIVEEDKSAGGVSDVIYQGSSDNLHPYFYYFDFIPSCPIKPTSFNISVSAEVKPVTSFLELKSKKLLHTLQKSNLQNRMFSSYLEVNQSDYKNNHGYTVDYSKYKLGDRFQIFSHKIDYSFVSNKSQIIIGSVVKRINSTYIIPVEKATIKITSLDFPECQTSTILTDKDGNFVSDKLYIYDTGLKTNYLITVTANDLTKHERIISTGGIGAPEEIDLGKFELWSTAILDSTHISSFILDALDNAPLRDVKVSLFTGYKKSNIEEDNNAKAQAKSVKPSFIQLKTNKKASLLKDPGTIQLKAPTTMLHNELLKAFISNERGIYAFYDVSPGQYSLEFEKEGYYKEILNIDVIGKITPTIRSISLTPIVKSGKIRVVVSWPDAPSDLDMVSTFRLDKVDTKCEVFFGKKNCSQTSLQVDNNLRTRKGAETITIDMLENYIYTFAIRKYVDKSSDGLFPGEERVDGAPKNSDYNSKMLLDREKLEPLMNVTLSESKAKVSIFVNGYKSAIQEIYVPENPQKNLLFKKDQNNPYLDWWLAFCLDGAEGLTSMKIVNKLSSENPNESYCEKYYNKQPKAKILIANITETSDSQPTSQMNTNATEITVPSSGILNKTLSFVQKSQSIFNLNMKKLDPKNLHYYRF